MWFVDCQWFYFPCRDNYTLYRTGRKLTRIVSSNFKTPRRRREGVIRVNHWLILLPERELILYITGWNFTVCKDLDQLLRYTGKKIGQLQYLYVHVINQLNFFLCYNNPRWRMKFWGVWKPEYIHTLQYNALQFILSVKSKQIANEKTGK